MHADCPKCSRQLKPCGQLGDVPVFQCPECLVDVELFGDREQVALTFVVRPDGVAIDPATDQPIVAKD